jgi:hypothetical protein
MNEAFEKARSAIEADNKGRQRAEAVRRVIEKIVVTFKDSGKAKPVEVGDQIRIYPASDVRDQGMSPPATRNQSTS